MSLPDNNQNYSNKVNPVQSKKKANKAAIFAISIVLLSSIGFATFLLISSSNKPNGTSTANNSTNNVVVSSSSLASLESSSQPSDPLTESVISKEDLQAERQKVTDFNSKGIVFNAEDITAKPLTTENLKVLKTDFGSEAKSIVAESGKKIKLTIKYSSIGDRSFEKGSLYIKLSQGLKIVPDSMKDAFTGSQEIAVANSVYNDKDNLIIYGPGTGDKSSNQIKVGEMGAFTMTVEVDSSFEVLGVASYIKEDGGKVGQPSIFFVEIKK
jgi:hypothetical protein